MCLYSVIDSVAKREYSSTPLPIHTCDQYIDNAYKCNVTQTLDAALFPSLFDINRQPVCPLYADKQVLFHMLP